ncbi:MAG TPA: hydroxypyruvate isomerase, partial [Chthoniobacteraceae bacterium]|nr:hydroxypyruvate isomerase [Chthoniobacteraceae bacterium]
MPLSRRSSLKHLAAAVLGAPLLAAATESAPGVKHGRIKQSIVPWCFKPLTVPELAQHAAKL